MSEVVLAVPPGCVVTYGQVAQLAGRPRAARAVGWALAQLPDGSDVPWHRVLSANGRIPARPGGAHLIQARRLRREGVRVRMGRVDLSRYGLRLDPDV